MDNKSGIIILNYNCSDETIKCVKNIHKHFVSQFTIYIVDNCSSLEEIKKLINYVNTQSNITFVKANENRGYSAGNNIGIKRAIDDGCDYILIMNPDVEVKNDILTELIIAINSNDGLAIAAPRIFDRNGEDGQYIRRNYTFQYALFDKKPICYLKNIFHNNIMYNYNPTRTFIFEGSPSGACFLMTSHVFEKIGFFDENVFLYSEEYILGIKIARENLKCIYNPDAEVIHLGGESTKVKSNNFKDFHTYASEYYLLVRYCNITSVQRIIIKWLRVLNYTVKSLFRRQLRDVIKLINMFDLIESNTANVKIIY